MELRRTGFGGGFRFYSWWISYRELRARKDPNESTWEEIVGGKDPTVFTVFLEDSVGLIGVVLAFLAIFLGRQFNNPYLDPIASIVIGCVLAVIAVFLGRESGALLVGRGPTEGKSSACMKSFPRSPRTESWGLADDELGPEQVLLNVNIQFRRSLTLEQLESAIERIESRIRQEQPSVNGSLLKRSHSRQRRSRRAKLHERRLKNKRPASSENLRAAGVLFGIDQEVVTLRGLYGNSGSWCDLRQAEFNPNSPVVCGL